MSVCVYVCVSVCLSVSLSPFFFLLFFDWYRKGTLGVYQQVCWLMESNETGGVFYLRLILLQSLSPQPFVACLTKCPILADFNKGQIYKTLWYLQSWSLLEYHSDNQCYSIFFKLREVQRSLIWLNLLCIYLKMYYLNCDTFFTVAHFNVL